MATLTRRALLVQNDVTYVAPVDLERYSDVLLFDAGLGHRAYRSNRVVIQFMASSQLLGHVLHVVAVFAWDQMRRIATRRIVALMENVERGWAVLKFPRDTMCADAFPVDLESSVAASFEKQSSPRPALVWLASMNLRPEALFQALARVNAACGVAFQVFGRFASDLSTVSMSDRVGLRVLTATAGAQSLFHVPIIAWSTR